MAQHTKAIYAGSFDPLTFGHLNVIERGARIADRLVVAVANNSSKAGVFTPSERIAIIERSVGHLKNVEVDTFEGLLVDYAKRVGATMLLRGLRSVNDFQYEFQMALTNKDLSNNIDTVFLATEGKYAHVASSLIREIVAMGGSVKGMVPKHVEKSLADKLAPRKRAAAKKSRRR